MKMKKSEFEKIKWAVIDFDDKNKIQWLMSTHRLKRNGIEVIRKHERFLARHKFKEKSAYKLMPIEKLLSFPRLMYTGKQHEILINYLIKRERHD